MPTIPLTALRPENPVAVMAAYGALRLLPGAELRWARTHPELRWDGEIIPALAQRLPERAAAPEVTLLDDPRDKNIGGVAGFRRLAEQIPHEWLGAYCSETERGIASTDLLLLSGGHRFVRAAREIMAALARTPVAQRIEEALIGPWAYQDEAQAWGWDAAVRPNPAALPMPTANAHKPGVLGAYWLAWESLPLWMMVGAHTVGMRREHGAWTWTYPTAAEWLSWHGLRALVLGVERLPDRERRALGVRTWAAPVMPTSQFGREFGMARTPSKAQTPVGSRLTQAPDSLII